MPTNSIYDEKLAAGLKAFNNEVRTNQSTAEEFQKNPTATLKKFLSGKSVEVPDPDTFHAHTIKVGDELPQEPERATVDRSIYIFRASGIFEYKNVPGSSSGDDDFMYHPKRACACCNCCVLEF